MKNKLKETIELLDALYDLHKPYLDDHINHLNETNEDGEFLWDLLYLKDQIEHTIMDQHQVPSKSIN
jgi:hypothetical protein